MQDRVALALRMVAHCEEKRKSRDLAALGRRAAAMGLRLVPNG